MKDGDTDWLGLTCAACHTNEVDFGGNTWRIDGAPALADTWAFLNDLGESLKQTAASPDGDKFRRFATNLRPPATTAAQRTDLHTRLKTFTDGFAKFVDSSRTEVPWGHARIDAFGMIFNRATGINLDRWQNTRPPDAPVSMPFLWDTHWHDFVQWNASAPNAIALQRLGRNVGEVLGVFAHVTPDTRGLLRVESSARPRQLLDIEHRLSRLRSPDWPFGGIDQAAAQRGAAIYKQVPCELPRGGATRSAWPAASHYEDADQGGRDRPPHGDQRARPHGRQRPHGRPSRHADRASRSTPIPRASSSPSPWPWA